MYLNSYLYGDRMLRVGFYGHSNCAYRGDDSLIDIVAGKINGIVVNTGVRQGSEERILFELKKTKDLDLAIIFHSEPQFIFVPNTDRDLSMKQLTSDKSEYLFSEFSSHYHQLHHKKFVELFKTSEELKLATHYLKTYFHHPDLQLNRFYGSLLQIDQYLHAKSIQAIHVIPKNSMPAWFEFKSGIVNHSIVELFDEYRTKPNEVFANVMTKEGNKLVAEKLLHLIGRGGEIRTHEPIAGLQESTCCNKPNSATPQAVSGLPS
jgi:hypothetical protein